MNTLLSVDLYVNLSGCQSNTLLRLQHNAGQQLNEIFPNTALLIQFCSLVIKSLKI